MKAAIFTGSREWVDLEPVALELPLWDVVIHGDCPKGLDAVVAGMRQDYDTLIPMPAQWDKHGRAAGPKRNAEMLKVLLALRECGYEVSVQAFPLGVSKGTRGMMRLAETSGVAVEVHT